MPATRGKARKANASDDAEIEDASAVLSHAKTLDDQETEDDDDVEAERSKKASKVKRDNENTRQAPINVDSTVNDEAINLEGHEDKAEGGIPMKFHVSRFVEYEPQKIVALVGSPV
jgi:hypothetical protein